STAHRRAGHAAPPPPRPAGPAAHLRRPAPAIRRADRSGHRTPCAPRWKRGAARRPPSAPRYSPAPPPGCPPRRGRRRSRRVSLAHELWSVEGRASAGSSQTHPLQLQVDQATIGAEPTAAEHLFHGCPHTWLCAYYVEPPGRLDGGYALTTK